MTFRATEGKKTLYIWDKAGIDFVQWYRWKQGSAIYFLSLEKSNMVPMSPASLEFDKEDPVNVGIISDELAGYGGVALLRRIVYLCPETGQELIFLTNLNDIKKYPPGLIAQLYRMRWDIEKVFDVFKKNLVKSKFGQKENVPKRCRQSSSPRRTIHSPALRMRFKAGAASKTRPMRSVKKRGFRKLARK
jgi:IS4 transposase